MDALWLLFEIVINMLQCAFIAYFSSKTFPAKGRFAKACLYVLPLWLLDTCLQSIYLFISLPVPNFLSSFIIALVLTGVFRKGSFFRKLFWLVTYFVLYACVILLVRTIALGIEGVTPTFLSSQNKGRVIYVLTANTALASLTYLLARVAGKHSGETIDFKVMLVSCVLVITSLFVLLILLEMSATVETSDIGAALIVSAVALLVVNSLVLWLFQHINKQNAYVMQLSTEKQRMAMQVKHTVETAQIQDEWRTWRHDTKSRLQALTNLVALGKYDALSQYLNSVVTCFDSLPLQISTGNDMVDAVMNYRAELAKARGIQFAADVVFPPDLGIADDDLLIVLENMLENAFEACANISDTNERYVNIKGMLSQGYVTIKVENSMVHLPTRQGVFSFTSKANPQEHGIGLRIIEKVAAKYGGYTNCDCHDQKYIRSVLMMSVTDRA